MSSLAPTTDLVADQAMFRLELSAASRGRHAKLNVAAEPLNSA